jgi:hypothetical protein
MLALSFCSDRTGRGTRCYVLAAIRSSGHALCRQGTKFPEQLVAVRDMQDSGGFARNLSPAEVRLYRDQWVQRQALQTAPIQRERAMTWRAVSITASTVRPALSS